LTSPPPGGALVAAAGGPRSYAEVNAVVERLGFGYLEDDAQDELVLAEVARVLRPGGRFLQELAGREALVCGWHDSEVTRTATGWSCSRSGPSTCAAAGSGSATPC
jgi:SAM-dependent methyltransferase